jgi:protein-S-isoprenylcysteine O-methyltransferase Ste14
MSETGRAAADADHADVRILPPLLFLGSIALGVVLQWIVALRFAEGSGARVALGIALVLLGLAGGAWAFVTMRRTNQDPDPRAPSPELIPGTGPYAFSRNPMYVGMALIQTGVAIALGNAWVLLLLVPTLWILRREVIEKEEAYLARKFGDAYAAYRARVRRWI